MSDIDPGAVRACSAGHALTAAGTSRRCPTCKRDRALTSAAEAIASSIPAVSQQLARTVLLRVAPDTRRAERAAAHLAEHPTALTSGDSSAPHVITAVIGELRDAGVAGLVDPRCMDCGEAKYLHYRVPGGRVCNACEKRRRPVEPCARCGQLSRRGARLGGVTVGECCYVAPAHRCTVCGVNRSGRSYRTRRRICPKCEQRPNAQCEICGRAAAIPEHGAAARCVPCATGSSAPCEVCGELTIARDRQGRVRCEKCYRRPIGTCGRCGKVRAIVRKAVGDDPDLCALCWHGPTKQCEGCGKVRPCRGERHGRWLCRSCSPVKAQRCALCGRDRRPMAHWPEGPVCNTCYHRALSAKDVCPRCGRMRRLLRYPGFDEPVCRDCAGASDDAHVCQQCGAEESLQYRGICARCRLEARLTELLGERSERARAGLAGLFDALLAARSPKDTLRWLDSSPAVPILTGIAAGELPCCHETLDQLPPSGAIRYLEYLLVSTGALLERDPALARLDRWIDEFLSGTDSDQALRTFARWVVLRRYRRKSARAPLNAGVLSRAKTELRSAGAFLQWLDSRCVTLSDCRQADVDAWLAAARPDRHVARSFVRWAIAQKLMPDLEFDPGPRAGPTAPIPNTDRFALARRLLADQTLATRDRVAGLLIVLFAQPVNRVARLTIDDVTITNTRVSIRLGRGEVTVPNPLARHVRDLIADRRGSHAANVPAGRWLFPGGAPGRPINEQVLSRRLRQLGVECWPARRDAMAALPADIPAALLADLLGVHVVTAIKWAEIAGRPWGEYPTLRRAAQADRCDQRIGLRATIESR
jgi:hypothetical protein